MPNPQRYLLIACAVVYRECYHCAALCRNIIDIRLCDKGLHDIGAPKMCSKLQAEVDAVDRTKYDAILLAYGLCNNGTIGLRSPIPIVIPRAHDCITLLMGSKERYRKYFDANPGTYFLSSGWSERGTSSLENEQSTISAMGIRSYDDYVKEYGEETAKYLMETLGSMKHYTKLAYIDTHVGDFPVYKADARQLATDKGWEYEEIPGSPELLMRLANGEWNDNDFVVIEPGQTTAPSYNDGILKSV
ncbi:MAG: DUF1638 domain-containing protein [Verrucomicrobiota bacterium]